MRLRAGPQESKARQPQPTAVPKTCQPPAAATGAHSQSEPRPHSSHPKRPLIFHRAVAISMSETERAGSASQQEQEQEQGYREREGRSKGRLAGAGAGAEAARGARVRVDATRKVRATCSRFNPDNISCELAQFRSGGQRRISSEEGFFASIKVRLVFTVTMLQLYNIYP